jgi:hypothetical protein
MDDLETEQTEMQYNNKNSFWLGCHPTKQDPRHPPRNRGGSDKLATRTNNRQNTCLLSRRGDIYVGIWNVRTMKDEGALEILIDQLEHYQWEIIGLCETHHTEKGEFITVAIGYSPLEEKMEYTEKE